MKAIVRWEVIVRTNHPFVTGNDEHIRWHTQFEARVVLPDSYRSCDEMLFEVLHPTKDPNLYHLGCSLRRFYGADDSEDEKRILYPYSEVKRTELSPVPRKRGVFETIMYLESTEPEYVFREEEIATLKEEIHNWVSSFSGIELKPASW